MKKIILASILLASCTLKMPKVGQTLKLSSGRTVKVLEIKNDTLTLETIKHLETFGNEVIMFPILRYKTHYKKLK